MQAVRLLVGIGVVAGCREADELVVTPTWPAIVERDVSSPEISISVRETGPTQDAGAATSAPPRPVRPPPRAIESAVAVAPLTDDGLEQVERDDSPIAIASEGEPDRGPWDEPHDRLSLGTRARRHSYGLAFDVGLPDGVTAALVVNPRRALAVSAGLSFNGISYGGRAGVTWTPLSGTVSPTLSVDIGHFTDGDANPLARLVTGNPMFSSPVLDHVGYDFANAQVGLAITRSTFALFVRAGVSRVTGAVHDLSGLAGGKMVTVGTDPTVTLTTLSARIGLILYFGR